MKKDYKVFHGKGGLKNFISTIPVVGNGIYFKGYSISDGETLNYRRDEDDSTQENTEELFGEGLDKIEALNTGIENLFKRKSELIG